MTLDTLTAAQYDALTADEYDAMLARERPRYDTLTGEQYDTLTDDEYDEMGVVRNLLLHFTVTSIDVIRSGITELIIGNISLHAL